MGMKETGTETILNGNTYRYKFQEMSLRKEVLSVIPASSYTPEKRLWTRILSGYYKDLTVVNGRISGMKR